MYGLPAGAADDNSAEAKKDKGPVVFPKFFRRLVGFSENQHGTATLAAFLALPVNKRDVVIDLEIFKTLTPFQRSHPTEKTDQVLHPCHRWQSSGPKARGPCFCRKASRAQKQHGESYLLE